MKKLYYIWTNAEDLHPAFFEEGTQPINSQLIQEPYIQKPVLSNGVVVESITQEEINALNFSNLQKKEAELYKKRMEDAKSMYAEISAEFRLAKLSGIITEAQHGAIETALIPVRNEVLAGQWKSALMLLEGLGASIGTDLYNRLHLQISNYINENY